MEKAKATFGRFIPNPKLKLLEQVQEVCRVRHFSLRTEQAYSAWIRRYLRHVKERDGQWRHPKELGAPDVNDVSTTMNYSHVMAGPALVIQSSLRLSLP